jgi:hypothetical protein
MHGFVNVKSLKYIQCVQIFFLPDGQIDMTKVIFVFTVLLQRLLNMDVCQYGVDYPRRLTMKIKDLNPVFVKGFISNPTTCMVLLLTLHFKECVEGAVQENTCVKDMNHVDNLRCCMF